MTHFQWRAAGPSDASLQLQSVGDVGQCLTSTGPAEALGMVPCAAGGQLWARTANSSAPGSTLVDVQSGLCLDASQGPPDEEPLDVWGGPLAGGARVALLVNRRGSAANVTLAFADLGLPVGAPVALRDLYARADLPGTYTGTFTAAIAPHASLLLKVTLHVVGAVPTGDDDVWRPEPLAMWIPRRRPATAQRRTRRNSAS